MTTENEVKTTFDQTYEKAEQLLDSLLEKAASPYTWGPERRAAKIGAMKSFILANCARHPELFQNLQAVASI